MSDRPNSKKQKAIAYLYFFEVDQLKPFSRLAFTLLVTPSATITFLYHKLIIENFRNALCADVWIFKAS
jgi:hypothetical protein